MLRAQTICSTPCGLPYSRAALPGVQLLRRHHQRLRAAGDEADLARNEENVQRLLKRDRKELLATESNFVAEWDRPGTTPRSSPPQDDEEPSSSQPSAPVASAPVAVSPRPAASPKSPFGAPQKSPFADAPQKSPFDSVMSPEQSAAPLKKSPFAASSGASNPFGDSDALWRNSEAEWMPEDDLKWYQSFSKDQVLLGLSFVLVIVLMVATFALVLKLGAISLNAE